MKNGGSSIVSVRNELRLVGTKQQSDAGQRS
jgi:hypothetical protein